MRLLIVPILLLTATLGSLHAADQSVQLLQEADSVKVLIGPDVFTVYRYGDQRRKPFFQPVTGPGGFELLQNAVESAPAGDDSRKVFVASNSVQLEGDGAGTAQYADILDVGKIEGDKLWIEDKQGWIARSDVAPLAAIVTRIINDNPKPIKDRKHPDYYDHPHHKGIWFSVDEINEIKFWMEDSLIVNQKVEIGKPASSENKSGQLKIVNHWLNKQNEPILVETTTVTISPNRLMTYSTKLSPAGEEVHIGDTKEGLFAIRLTNSMRELVSGGPVTNSAGDEGTKAAWGKPAKWVNYVGPVQGHSFGVTLMDASDNPFPSRYHVRDYGLFSVNPFGQAAYTKDTDDPQEPFKRTLKKGESLEFTYGLWVHEGDVKKAAIEKTYKMLSDGQSR